MNILQEQDHNTNELRRCKTAFLQSQNSWMRTEHQFISQLIVKYKQIIELTHRGDDAQAVSRLQQDICRVVAGKMKEYQQLKEMRGECEAEMTNEEFLGMVESFEGKIVRLQADIKDREGQLQELQERKGREGGRERRVEIRCLTNIQVHGKLVERVRREIVELKNKKKRLENKVIAAKQGGSEEEQTLPTLSVGNKLSHPVAKQESEMSVFEKAVLVLKKKRFENEMLQDRISSMRKKLEEKRFVSERLRDQIERGEWRCLQGLQGCNGYVEGNCEGDISIADKSLSPNSMSFSFDISRFIKPKAKGC